MFIHKHHSKFTENFASEFFSSHGERCLCTYFILNKILIPLKKKLFPKPAILLLELKKSSSSIKLFWAINIRHKKMKMFKCFFLSICKLLINSNRDFNFNFNLTNARCSWAFKRTQETHLKLILKLIRKKNMQI